ncbi:MAG: hypothetical protein K0S68_1109, partial [Candidatus Saccharibacteria bacterium]|nr:hypothetical protein [Candidatus Saccharibacteria bacterium]
MTASTGPSRAKTSNRRLGLIPRRRPSNGVLLACLAAMLVLGVVVVLNTRAATCTVDAKLVNSCRPWLSAATAHYTMAGDAWTSSVQFPYFEKRLNNPEVLSNVNAATTVSKKLDFVHTYAGYGDTVSTWEKSMVNRANTYLQLNWKPTPGAFNLADGRDATVNSNIDKMANSI